MLFRGGRGYCRTLRAGVQVLLRARALRRQRAARLGQVGRQRGVRARDLARMAVRRGRVRLLPFCGTASGVGLLHALSRCWPAYARREIPLRGSAAPPWHPSPSSPLQLHGDTPLLTLQTRSADSKVQSSPIAEQAPSWAARRGAGALEHTSCVRRRWASCVCDAASSRSAQLSRLSSAACRCTSAPRHSAARAPGVRGGIVCARRPLAASVQRPAWRRTLRQLRRQLRPAALLGRSGRRQPPLQVLCAPRQQCYISRCRAQDTETAGSRHSPTHLCQALRDCQARALVRQLACAWGAPVRTAAHATLARRAGHFSPGAACAAKSCG